MDQYRGRGRGARGAPAPNRGRGGNPPQNKGPITVPLAQQLRQIRREIGGNEESNLLKRFSPIGADRIRSEYGPGGLLKREVRLPGPRWGDEPAYLPLEEAEDRLRSYEVQRQALDLCRRALARLGREITPADLPTLEEEDMRVLRMSQKEYNSFRGFRATDFEGEIPLEAGDQPVADAAPPLWGGVVPDPPDGGEEEPAG
jgi:hypothetical protein